MTISQLCNFKLNDLEQILKPVQITLTHFLKQPCSVKALKTIKSFTVDMKMLMLKKLKDDDWRPTSEIVQILLIKFLYLKQSKF